MCEEQTIYIHPTEHEPLLIGLWGHTIHEFPLAGHQSFGRPSKSSHPDLSVPVGTVSRTHGAFLTNQGYCAYMDQGSSNGTLLNGKRLAPDVWQELHDGDRLQIHGQGDHQNDADVLLLYSTTYRLHVPWQTLPLDEQMVEIQIGRQQALRLQDPGVSRLHASFFHSQGGWAIIDHESLNGVYVNNQRVTTPRYLMPMDVIRIAGYLFLFGGDCLYYQAEESALHAPTPTSSSTEGALSIQIEEKNVWHRMKKKTLLRDIHLEIASGSFVLILGGSGAGKTTFMNAVMGYEPAEGEVRYRDTDIYSEYDKMKYEIGYVPQQDLLRLNDTVYDTLYNAATMRLPRGWSPERYAEQVEKTLRTLGLEREKAALVKKLSGGQRKRLSIAVEYVGNPSLFFLDEPDSGLDGTMARALMENLRAIADEGKIVMVISHSPDRAADLFDQVIVLGKGNHDDTGHLIYNGTPDEACRFFDVDRLEPIVRRINRADEGGEGLADYYIARYASQENTR